ncbi:tyrosine-protein kinase [Streptococcus loxodontisalivarius]|uniref:Tyrosine-protein kinase CpsD n=1 Tax=Streptococcus loxodontisalivarius TaxID=1349415 RepID=A0ABS2PP98_9STRE|nr:tyrosine-protein kinase [Streptococcus loxodontisalivarius]MBM7641768.1 capsular exopolysaccharide synthesis family protein [Streptococcus loxodontisalivarius]
MAQLELVRNQALQMKQTEEYYNSIRTNIQFSGSDLRTIVITSVQPGEGKSTTSVNLAVSFARAGFRTLLIDADTRNSVMSGVFKATERIDGLTAYLSGAVELSDVITTTNVENLMVVSAGKIPPNPTSLLQNANFDYMIETTRNLYDIVIIDTPPIGLVVDAAIVAQKCDASLIVTEAGAIKRRFVQKAKAQMEQSGAQFLGVILNKADIKETSYGSYGAYGDYGKQNDSKSKSKSKKRRKKEK